MREDDKYGFQTRDVAAPQTEPAVIRETPPASSGGVAPSLEQAINPKNHIDADHVRASEMYGWYARSIDDYLQRYVRNPTVANKNLLDDILSQYSDAFRSGQVWCWNAKHE